MSLSDTDVQKAVRRSLQTEKNAMDFYQAAAKRMQDPDAKRVFELLSREEREHAGTFFKIYREGDIPSLDTYLNTPPEHEAEWLAALGKLFEADFTEAKALKIALDKEAELEKALRNLASQMTNPEVKAVYELNADETRKHYLLVEAEYARVMGMVHESDMDTFVRE
jgi:rubrerythrin